MEIERENAPTKRISIVIKRATGLFNLEETFFERQNSFFARKRRRRKWWDVSECRRQSNSIRIVGAFNCSLSHRISVGCIFCLFIFFWLLPSNHNTHYTRWYKPTNQPTNTNRYNVIIMLIEHHTHKLNSKSEIKFADNEAAYSRCTFPIPKTTKSNETKQKQIINNIIKWKQNGIIIAHLLAIKPHKIPDITMLTESCLLTAFGMTMPSESRRATQR